MGDAFNSTSVDKTAGYGSGTQADQIQRDMNSARSGEFYKQLTGEGGAFNPTSTMNYANGNYNNAMGLSQQADTNTAAAIQQNAGALSYLPYAQKQYDYGGESLTNAAVNLNAQGNYTDQAAGYGAQAGAVGNSTSGFLNNYQSKLTNALNQTQQGAYGEYAAANPDIIRQAQAATTAAMQPYGKSMQETAMLQSEAARRAMEQRLANGGMLGTDSGAGRTALMQAIIEPYARMNTELASKNADVFSSIYNPQAQAALGNTYGKTNNLLSALGTTSQANQGLANIYGTAGQNLLGAGGQYLDASGANLAISNMYNQRGADQLGLGSYVQQNALNQSQLGNNYYNSAGLAAQIGGQQQQLTQEQLRLLAEQSQQYLVAPQFATQQGWGSQLAGGVLTAGGAIAGGYIGGPAGAAAGAAAGSALGSGFSGGRDLER